MAAAAVVVPVAAPVAPADPAGSTAPQEFTTPNLGFKVTVTSLPSSRRRLRVRPPRKAQSPIRGQAAAPAHTRPHAPPQPIG